MKAPSIDELQSDAAAGHLSGSVFIETVSLFVVSGMSQSLPLCSTILIVPRYSMLPAISLDGIIFVRIVEGSFTSSLFKDFIEGLLHHMQPFPAPRSVIIMDNCRIHKDPRIIDLIEMRGMRIEFLPPYSPDFNPIEPSFSAIKAYVRRTGILGREDLEEDGNDDYVYLHLIDAAYRIGPAHAEGYFHHSGYI